MSPGPGADQIGSASERAVDVAGTPVVAEQVDLGAGARIVSSSPTSQSA